MIPSRCLFLERLRSSLVGIKFFELFASKQFHAHGSHFAEFNRRMAVVPQRLITRGEDVERMARLMKESAHIAVQPNRVHEDERQPRLR